MLTRLLSRYWLLLPLLILVVIAVDRIEAPPVIEIEETIDMRQTRSDYYLAEFKTQKFRTDGSLEYTIQGDTLAHYPDNDRSEIIAPRIELNRLGATWDISSLKARFDTNPDLFTMHGEVIMHQRRDNTDPITITTDQLTVATESNLVSTDADIEIVSAHWALKATGMSSAIDEGTLSLLSSVSVRYDAPSR
ncbi:MAG: lipopolysaccharide export system protein LptC [Granulosicoccus sp.]|jgi:lipopolysaccharide export system protein LptC